MKPKNPAIAGPETYDGHSNNAPTEVLQSVHYRGAIYELRLINCGKPNCRKCNSPGGSRPAHGPYWYLRFTQGGRTRRKYLGKDLDTRLYRDSSGRISLTAIAAARAKNPPPDPDLAPSTLEDRENSADLSEIPAKTESFLRKARNWLQNGHHTQNTP